ncbi:MAG: tRNA pseudouridine(55) synthase TruB, partial [Candidatus Neomarinimicrobiota bacterium]
MILNIYKPNGITSFGVVKKIRKIVGEKKVGHGGTLDPFAEGVLIIGTGSDTKELKRITDTDKTYTASIELGRTTNTLDPEGDVIEKKKIPRLSESKINKVLDSFLGVSMQTPPMFSAKKIGGVKLYELARKNIIVDREPSQINISSINL